MATATCEVMSPPGYIHSPAHLGKLSGKVVSGKQGMGTFLQTGDTARRSRPQSTVLQPGRWKLLSLEAEGNENSFLSSA